MKQTVVNVLLYFGLIVISVIWCQGVYYIRWGCDSDTPKGLRRIMRIPWFTGVALAVYFGYRTKWFISAFVLIVCLVVHFILRHEYFDDLFEWNVIQKRDPTPLIRYDGLGARDTIQDSYYESTGCLTWIILSISLYFCIRFWPGGTFVQLLYASASIVGLAVVLFIKRWGCR